MHFHMWAAQFLFEDTQNCLLFPSLALRNAYINSAAQELGACAEEQHILLRQLQERLCMHIAHALEKPLRILTFAERSSMYQAFLLQKDMQRAILKLENSSYGWGLKNEQKYAAKLERILSHYALMHAVKYKKDARSLGVYETVRFIAQRYYDFVVFKAHCIDYACATIALCERHESCAEVQSYQAWKRIFVFAPGLFPVAAHAWLQHFISVFPQAFTHAACTHALGKSREHVRNTAPPEEEKSTNAFFLKKPTRTRCYMFTNVAEELNWACSTAAQLQKQGVLPHEIAFSISGVDDFISAELDSLGAKYELRLTREYMHNTRSSATLHAFLKNMEACVTECMNPNALKHLLLFSAVPWNNREHNIALMTLGFKHSCIDDEELERWKGVLSAAKNASELKDYFFSLYKALRSILRARTQGQLRQEFTDFAKTFLYTKNTRSPFFGNTVHRILEIVEELAVHEAYVQQAVEGKRSAVKTASPWSVLCSVALRRSTAFSKNENAIFVYEFPDSLGTYYEHHFFLGLSQKGLKKISAPPLLFDECMDAEIFDQNSEGTRYSSELAAQYKNAMEGAGAHVYISTSREDYTGMRITPTEWNFIEHPKHVEDTFYAASARYDPWVHEERLWREKSEVPHVRLTQLQCSQAQCEGMRAQQHTRRLTLRTMLQSSLLPSTQEIVRENFEAGTIAMGTIATLMADPVCFLLQNVFAVAPLFDDMREDFDMPLVLGSAFHAVLARIFSGNAHSANTHGAHTHGGKTQALVEEVLRSLHAHAFVKMPLRAVFESQKMYDYIACMEEFFTRHMERVACSVIKTEETDEVFLHEVFPWARGEFSKLRLRGRSDALLCNAQDEVRYIVDYKTKLKTPLGYFAQLWLYARVHARGTEASQVPAALFLLLKNFHRAGLQKELVFQTPSEKQESHMANYEALLQLSLTRIFCEGGKYQRLEESLHKTQAALTRELFEDFNYACIARNYCYIYQNYMSLQGSEG